MIVMPSMKTETKEQVLQKGTVVKLNGFPYELLDTVKVSGTVAVENDPAIREDGLGVGQVGLEPL